MSNTFPTCSAPPQPHESSSASIVASLLDGTSFRLFDPEIEVHTAMDDEFKPANIDATIKGFIAPGDVVRLQPFLTDVVKFCFEPSSNPDFTACVSSYRTTFSSGSPSNRDFKACVSSYTTKIRPFRSVEIVLFLQDLVWVSK